MWAMVRSNCRMYVPKTSLTSTSYKNIWDTNQEICTLHHSLYPTTEGPFHIGFLKSTKMAASLLQVLVLFPNIEFPNSPTIIFLLLLIGVLLLNIFSPELFLNSRQLSEYNRWFSYFSKNRANKKLLSIWTISPNLNPKLSRNYSNP